MAGIEKICEYSGDYPAHSMYGYKRDHIQICPEYRKEFRGADHILHIFEPKECRLYKWGGYSSFPTFWDYDSGRIVYEYDYCLEVFDDKLKGNVNGLYMNSSFNIGSVKRRLKRMLRAEMLIIAKHDCSYIDWKRGWE